MDNVPFGVAVAFPRKWGHLTAAAISRDLMRTIGYQTYLHSLQKDFASFFDTAILRYSPTACLIWKVRNSQLENYQSQQYYRAMRLKKDGVSPCSSGPKQHFDTKEQLYNYCAEIWARSSELMQDLCEANQIQYFHFLQPNQYLPDSKPIGTKEATYVLNGESPFAAPVRVGYPVMRAMASRFKAAGVEFTDLTQIFAAHPEPIYVDDCCHVKPAGDLIMAEAISNRIIDFYSSKTFKASTGNE
jgi:hypothetical protein